MKKIIACIVAATLVACIGPKTAADIITFSIANIACISEHRNEPVKDIVLVCGLPEQAATLVVDFLMGRAVQVAEPVDGGK